jgi:hypothetical protein
MKRLLYRVGVVLLALGSLVVLLTPALGQGEETATVISLRAPLHEEASAQSATVAMLSRGTVLTVLDFAESRTWMQAETADGLVGWISVVHVWIHGPYVPPEDGLTRTVIDGRADDWERFTGPFTDAVGDTSGAVDIRAVRSFMNESYLYVLVEASGDLRAVRLLLVDLVTNTAGEYRTYQYALPRHQVGTLFVVTEEQGEARSVADGLDYRDEAIEFRIPLESLDTPDSLNLVAVRAQELVGGELVTTDELVDVMPTVVTLEVEPDVNGAVGNERLNLRAAPATGRVLRVLPPEEPLRILGRSADSAWLYVRVADTLQGWVSAEYVETDLVIDTLSVEP